MAKDQNPKLEITEYDLNLIRSLAIDEYVRTNKPAHVCMVDIILDFINKKGFDIIKDETREPSWTQPTRANYTEYKPVRTKW